jgi:hypothetical protein
MRRKYFIPLICTREFKVRKKLFPIIFRPDLKRHHGRIVTLGYTINTEKQGELYANMRQNLVKQKSPGPDPQHQRI